MRQLILGGARSGKSRWAERLASDSGLAVTYIATATAGDGEMADRIQHHRERRPAHWQLAEEAHDLAAALQKHCAPDRVVLVDCLTLWLSNLMFDADPQRWPTQRKALLECLATLPGQLLMVSNEIGQGVIPMGAENRRYVDELGWLHQDIAAGAERVWFVIAGLPQLLKDTAPGAPQRIP